VWEEAQCSVVAEEVWASLPGGLEEIGVAAWAADLKRTVWMRARETELVRAVLESEQMRPEEQPWASKRTQASGRPGASAVPVLKYIALLFVCMNFKLCFTWFTENKQLSMLHACLTSFEFWSSYIMLEGEQNPVLVSSFAYIHVSASILVYLKLYVTLGRVELKPM
jgi:hypothetical protein